MFRLNQLVITLVLSVLGVGMLVGTASAAQIKDQPDAEYRIAEDQTINDDVFVNANRVVIEGIVNGNVFASGNNVTVSGTINGDLFVFGNTVEISGSIRNNLFSGAFSSELTKAKIGGNVFSAGQSVIFKPESSIAGSLFSAGNNVDVNTPIGRNAYLAGENVALNTKVGKGLYVQSQNLSLGEKTDVAGELKYDAQLDKNPSVVVSGKTADDLAKNSENSEKESNNKTSDFFVGVGTRIFGSIFGLISSMIVGLVWLALFKDNVARTLKVKIGNFGEAGLWGLVVGFIGLPLAIMLMITLVGLPLGVLVLGVWTAVLYLAKIFGGLIVGQFILEKLKKPIKNDFKSKVMMLLGGLSLYYLASLIPILGVLVTLPIWLIGAGGMLMSFPHHYHQKRTEKVAKK